MGVVVQRLLGCSEPTMEAVCRGLRFSKRFQQGFAPNLSGTYRGQWVHSPWFFLVSLKMGRVTPPPDDAARTNHIRFHCLQYESSSRLCVSIKTDRKPFKINTTKYERLFFWLQIKPNQGVSVVKWLAQR